MRKTYTPKQKASIALAALGGEQKLAQLSSEFQVHPNQIMQWRDTVRGRAPELFQNNNKQARKDKEKIDELYKIIGQRDTELEWLKKKLQPFDS